MTRWLGLYVALMSVAQAVTIELIRLAGTCIGATAAVLAAYWARQGRRELRSRRFAVRDPETEHAVVVDSPPAVAEHPRKDNGP
jgi:hypothetical protein